MYTRYLRARQNHYKTFFQKFKKRRAESRIIALKRNPNTRSKTWTMLITSCRTMSLRVWFEHSTLSWLLPCKTFFSCASFSLYILKKKEEKFFQCVMEKNKIILRTKEESYKWQVTTSIWTKHKLGVWVSFSSCLMKLYKQNDGS